MIFMTITSYKKSLAFLLTFLLFLVFLINRVDGQQKAFRATMGNDGIQRVEIVGGSYFFSPGYIIVKVNVPVELKIKKDSEYLTPHNIILNAPEAGITVSESLSAKSKIIRFTPTKTGKYPFYCDKKLLFFKSHRAKGMEGVLEVIE